MRSTDFLSQLESNPEENALEEYAKQVADEQNAKIAAEVIRLTDDMDRIANEYPKAVVPEVVFVNFFLHFFFNMTKGHVNDALLLKWIELAKGWYNEVDVVDNQNKVLFTVPAIYRQNVIASEEISGINFTTIGRGYQAMATRTSEEGTNFLLNQFQNLPKFINRDLDKDSLSVWAGIFLYYKLIDDQGKDLTVAPTNEPINLMETKSVKPKGPVIEDLGEYYD